ncbi:MAG: UDP-2,3-diacylglucosamine diphosphatase [Arcobacter sp.]|nr:UDP-2,3-diacylglucosamine diphosphatase [Arcobacter sp.]
MYLKINTGAIFVADSHYNDKNEEFLIFLKKLQNKEIITTQLFFMGDMFDFISSQSTYFVKRNEELIKIINELSNSIEIVYLEGNHDYNLESLFKNVKVYKREEQPLLAKYGQKSVCLSHGDNFSLWHYNLYCKIIRNKFILHFLNLIDFNNIISKKIYYTLNKKNICSIMNDFESFAKKRINNYKSDIIIEGHFHQGKSYIFNEQLYVNVPSLCCEKKYFILKEKFEGVSL